MCWHRASLPPCQLEGDLNRLRLLRADMFQLLIIPSLPTRIRVHILFLCCLTACVFRISPAHDSVCSSCQVLNAVQSNDAEVDTGADLDSVVSRFRKMMSLVTSIAVSLYGGTSKQHPKSFCFPDAVIEPFEPFWCTWLRILAVCFDAFPT